MIENAPSLPPLPPVQAKRTLRQLSIREKNTILFNKDNVIRNEKKSFSNSPGKPIMISNMRNQLNFDTPFTPLPLRSTLNKFSESKSFNATSTHSLFTKKRSKLERNIDAFLDSTPVLIMMSLFTIYALFSSDVQAAWLRKEVDEAFNIIPCSLLGIFGIEFLLNCISKRDYLFSFFFWLDLLATISFIQDIDYIMDPIMGYNQFSGSSTNKKNLQAAKAVAKVSSASRATRVLRIIRVIRLIRMIKLYKNVIKARESLARKKDEEERKKKELMSKEKETPSLNSSSEGSSKVLNALRKNDNSSTTRIPSTGNFDQGDNEKIPINTDINENKHIVIPSDSPLKEKEPVPQKQIFSIQHKKTLAPVESSNLEDDKEQLLKESKISRLVNESITKKVIVIILVLLIVFSFISEDFYVNDSTITYSLIAEMIANSINFQGNYALIKLGNMNDLFDENFPALNITSLSNGVLIYENTQYDKAYFRYRETKTEYSHDGSIQVIYSVLTETQMNGWLNIIQTVYICLCIVVATMSFEGQTDKLVLQPLEIMIEIVETVARDPINAKNVENLQTGIKAIISKNEEGTEHVYEIQVIKSAIIKISALLAIGFGDAGGEIIQKNLSSSSELNPRMKGKKKSAIFGFCDIRQFESITLALEEKTMVFVNEVAEIVHSSVDLFGGATNKNIGEAFLNVWKFYNETVIKGKPNELKKQFKRKDNLLEIDPANPQVAITADCSAWAFLRVLLKINKRWNILEYRNNPEIKKRITDFKLNMGFGLHMGYGIEGAVGSSYKIDASYLSPNVNIAARLESATRQFGVPLLISGVLHKLFSPEMKSLCRFVDCVKVKGSEQPLDLYTIDLNLNVSHQNKENILIMANKDKRQYYNEKKDSLKKEIELNGNVTRLILEKTSYLEMLRTKKTDQFYFLWDEGIAFYKKGNFRGAGERFKECISIDPSDGPARTLLSYIQSCHYNAPHKWEGTRELLSK